MSIELGSDSHSHWGRQFPQYVVSYTNEAVSTPLVNASESSMRIKAAKITNKICEGSVRTAHNGEDIAKYITLSMLRDLLESAKIPAHFDSMGEAKLVSGCVTLMASVTPSPLQCEYGYICFRVLVFAVNTCLLKHAGRLDKTISRMSVLPESQCLPTFWRDSTILVVVEESNGAEKLKEIIPAAHFDSCVLNRLLQLLDADQKQFLVVSKVAKSLGLSGLMFLFFKHEVDQRRYARPEDTLEPLIQPYSRVFWRYLLVTPDFEQEEEATIFVHNILGRYPELSKDKSIDVEDSRNVIYAYIDRLESFQPTTIVRGCAMVRFVAPLIVPGCEDLVPRMIKSSIWFLWDTLINLLPEEDLEVIRYTVQGMAFPQPDNHPFG